MFIYSIRASTVKMIGIAMLALVLIAGLALSGQGGAVYQPGLCGGFCTADPP